MADQDVVEHIGSLLGTTVISIPRAGRRMMYGTRIRGSRAVELMRDLAPLMSSRRQYAIARAIENYVPPSRKLDFAQAQVIRDFQTAVSVSRLSREFGVARSTIRQVLDGSIYAEPQVMPWRTDNDALVDLDAGTVTARMELCWLAGWLEGEGSFVRPPPSDPRRPRITAQTCDLDVAREGGAFVPGHPFVLTSQA